jgi:hypothetical protein
MTIDFQKLISSAGISYRTIGAELAFAYCDVFETVRICTQHEIAVLGVEIFEITKDGKYQAKGFSNYTLVMPDWSRFVKDNNALAVGFIQRNPFDNGHVCVFTTCSRTEYSNLDTGGSR